MSIMLHRSILRINFIHGNMSTKSAKDNKTQPSLKWLVLHVLSVSIVPENGLHVT